MRLLDLYVTVDLDGPVPEHVVAVGLDRQAVDALPEADRTRVEHALDLVHDALARADLLERSDAA